MTTTLLTPQQVQAELGLSYTRVLQLLQSGDLAASRVGPRRGRWRISRQDLDAYMARGRHAPRNRPSTPTRTAVDVGFLRSRGFSV